MPRPIKCRRVAFLPNITYFKPAGIPLRVLDEIRLSVDEAEAIRLKDLKGLDQEEGAAEMNVSRPTFQRILAAARQKIADALLNGKAIRVEGGSYEMALSRLRCENGHEWEVPLEKIISQPPEKCPVCQTGSIEMSLPAEQGREGKCRRRICKDNLT
ncbi:DUF134 domain-containing protein [Chloroflexota bacterium]